MIDLEVALKPSDHDIGFRARSGPTECAPIVTHVALHSDLSVDLEGHGLAIAENADADELGQVFCTRHVVTRLVQKVSWLESPSPAPTCSMILLGSLLQRD